MKKAFLVFLLGLMLFSSCRNQTSKMISDTVSTDLLPMMSSRVENIAVSSTEIENSLSSQEEYTIENPYKTSQLGFENEVDQKIYLFQTRNEIEEILGTPSSSEVYDTMGPNISGNYLKTYYDTEVKYHFNYAFVYQEDICICILIQIEPKTPETTWTFFDGSVKDNDQINNPYPSSESIFFYYYNGVDYITPYNKDTNTLPNSSDVIFRKISNNVNEPPEDQKIGSFILGTNIGGIIMS